MAVIAVAEGKPVTLLNHFSLCPETEAVLYERIGSPPGAGDANSTLIMLIAAIANPDCIPTRCDEDVQAMWS